MMPTAASLLGLYASMSTSIMLLRTLFDQLLPRPLQRYILNVIRSYWKPKSSKLTLLFKEKDDMTNNHMFIVAEAVLCSRINPDSNILRLYPNIFSFHSFLFKILTKHNITPMIRYVKLYVGDFVTYKIFMHVLIY